MAPASLHRDPRPTTHRRLPADSGPSATGLHNLLRNPRTAVLIPRVLHSASRDDWSDVIAAVRDTDTGTGAPTWQLMNLTILCHEPWARADAAATVTASDGSYLTYTDVRALTVPEDICAAMPKPDPVAIYGAPARVAVPMLLINGEADPQDPPGNVASADRTYPGSLAVTAAGESHQFTGAACMADVIDAFIDRASTHALPSGCLAHAPPAEFALG
jgi:pimeloyl-ACP methyl ester carboxylesterase